MLTGAGGHGGGLVTADGTAASEAESIAEVLTL